MITNATEKFPVANFDETVTLQPVFDVKPVVNGFVAKNSLGQPLFSKNGVKFMAITTANYLEEINRKHPRDKQVVTLSGNVETLRIANIKINEDGSASAVVSMQHNRKVVKLAGNPVWIEVQ